VNAGSSGPDEREPACTERTAAWEPHSASRPGGVRRVRQPFWAIDRDQISAIIVPIVLNRSAILAIVFDCDDTLAPDTTSQLLKAKGFSEEDLKRFWKAEIGGLVQQEWDPTVATMTKLAELANSAGPLAGLTLAEINEIGLRLTFYGGIPGMFSQVKGMIEADPEFSPYGIRVEFYIISGGIEELMRARADVAVEMRDIWGCSFEYAESGLVRRPKRVVSFTEKTKFLFNIQKGLVGQKYKSQPYAVNAKTPPEEVRVPFENMVYIGDGPSDIPCMSLLEKAGGLVIGILSEDNPYKTYASTYGRRAQFTIPPDYREGQIGRKHLDNAVRQVAKGIVRRIDYAQGQSPVPGY
jgi:hypothetical protein